MEDRTLRLALSFLKAAGRRKLIALLALAAVFAAAFVGYVSTNASERDALDWYVSTAFPDYLLTPVVSPYTPPPRYSTPSDLANLSREASNVSAALRAVSYVVSAGPYLLTSFVTFDRPTSLGSSTAALSFSTAAMFKVQQADYVDRVVAGTSDLGANGVLVPENVAGAERLAVGQTLPLYANSFFGPANCTGSCMEEPAYVNVTVQGIYSPKAGPVQYDNNVFPWTFSGYVVPVILNLSQLPEMVPALVPSNFNPWQQLQYDVSVSRNAVLDPLDATGTARRLGAMKSQMSIQAQKHALQVYSPLEYAYDHFLVDGSYLDLTVLLALAPVLLAAVVLGVMMETAEGLMRYRDLSIARARGVGLQRLRRVLWLEAVLETLFAALVGVVCSIVAVVILVPLGPTVLVRTYPLAAFSSFALCLAVAFGMKAITIRNLSKRTIAQGLVGWDDEMAGRDMSGRVAVASILVGLTLLGVSWFSTAPLLNVQQASVLLFGTERDWLLSFSFLAFIIAACLYTPRITNKFARGRRGPEGAKGVGSLYRAALVRSKRSPDPVVLLVAALVLSGSVYTAGLVALQQASINNAIYSETGSDILLTLPGSSFGGPAGSNNPPISAYLAVPGVSSLTFASSLTPLGGTSVVLVNASTYLGTVRTDLISYAGILVTALRGFSGGGIAVVNDAFAQSTGLGVGSTFGNLSITGVVPRMPGIQDPYEVDVPTIFADYRNYGLSPGQTSISSVLVRVEAGADPSEVSKQLSALDSLALVRNAAEETKGLKATPLFGALGSLWNVGLGAFSFLLLIVLGGYALRIRIELESDFARMRARGLPRRRVLRFLLAPVALTVLGSVLWGVGLGELFLLFMTEATSSAGGAPVAIVFPSPAVITLAAAFILGAMGLAVILARNLERVQLGPRLRERIV